jgi:hypothetical protein
MSASFSIPAAGLAWGSRHAAAEVSHPEDAPGKRQVIVMLVELR